MVATWALAHLSALRGREPRLPEALNDRAQDVWEPLLAIADEAGGDWPTLARKAALALSVETNDDEDISVQLLTDCRTVFEDADNPETMPSKAVVEALVAIEDRPWSSWSGGRPITQAKIARVLGGFGDGATICIIRILGAWDVRVISIRARIGGLGAAGSRPGPEQ
jgi:hypothetical protein